VSESPKGDFVPLLARFQPPAKAPDQRSHRAATVEKAQGSNAPDNASAAALAPALSRNPALRSLDLHGDGITWDGQEILADALEVNTHLCRLILGGKPHPRIAALMQRNPGLQAGGEPPMARDVALTRSVYR